MIYCFAVHENCEIVPKQVEVHSNKFYCEDREIDNYTPLYDHERFVAPNHHLTVSSLRQVCRTISRELDYFGSFYEVNNFCFYDITAVTTYLAAIRPRNRGLIKNITLAFDMWNLPLPAHDCWAFLQYGCLGLENLTLRPGVSADDSLFLCDYSMFCEISQMALFMACQPGDGLRGIKKFVVTIRCQYLWPFDPDVPFEYPDIHGFAEVGSLLDVGYFTAPGSRFDKVWPLKRWVITQKNMMMQPDHVRTPHEAKILQEALVRTNLHVWGESFDDPNGDSKPGMVSSRTRSKLSQPLSVLGIRTQPAKPTCLTEGGHL